MKRLTFLSHFCIVLAVAAMAFFAAINGVFKTIWLNDASCMTSVIGALFVVSAVYLGVQSWKVTTADSSFGHLSEGLAVRFGLIGTGVGIILTIKASLASTNPLGALQTAFFSMICGVAASCMIAVMTYSLERGIARARK